MRVVVPNAHLVLGKTFTGVLSCRGTVVHPLKNISENPTHLCNATIVSWWSCQLIAHLIASGFVKQNSVLLSLLIWLQAENWSPLPAPALKRLASINTPPSRSTPLSHFAWSEKTKEPWRIEIKERKQEHWCWPTTHLLSDCCFNFWLVRNDTTHTRNLEDSDQKRKNNIQLNAPDTPPTQWLWVVCAWKTMKLEITFIHPSYLARDKSSWLHCS